MRIHNKIIIYCILFNTNIIFSSETKKEETVTSYSKIDEICDSLPLAVQKYLKSLPSIKDVPTTEKEKAKIITDYLILLGGYSDNVRGTDTLLKKIENCIQQNKPIDRCMPAFPVSSSNPNKTNCDEKNPFGLGDLVALLTQYHISKEIEKVYQKGSCLSIYFEPYIYEMNNLCEKKMGAPLFCNQQIENYQNTLATIVKVLNPYIKIGMPKDELTKIYTQNYTKQAIGISSADEKTLKHLALFIEEEITSDYWTEQIRNAIFEKNKRTIIDKLNEYRKNNSKYNNYIDINRVIARILSSENEKEIKSKVTFSDIKKELNNMIGLKNKDNNKTITKHIVDQEIKWIENQFKNPSVSEYRHSIAKELATIVYKGTKRMALLLENEISNYKDMIRQSVRPDKDTIEKKIGTPMIWKVKGMPWQNTFVINESKQEISLAHYNKLKNPVKKMYVCNNRELPYVEIFN